MMASHRRRRTRYDAGPWSLQFTQVNDRGQASRPVIVNAAGKRVRASKTANAVIMAAAPELFETLDALAEQADFLLRVLRSEHPLAVEPAALKHAREMLARIRRHL